MKHFQEQLLTGLQPCWGSPGPDPPPNQGSVNYQISKAPQRSPSPMLPQVLGTRWYPGFDRKVVEGRKIHYMLNWIARKYDFTAVGETSISRDGSSRGTPYNAHGTSR